MLGVEAAALIGFCLAMAELVRMDDCVESFVHTSHNVKNLVTVK